MLSLGTAQLHAQKTALAVLDFDGFGLSQTEALGSHADLSLWSEK